MKRTTILIAIALLLISQSAQANRGSGRVEKVQQQTIKK